MKKDTPSRTAQYMALFRAIESVRSKQDRLFYDPFALNFLDTRLKMVVRISSLPLAKDITSKLIERQAPGAFSSGVARTRYIDDLLQKTINEGVKQVIILGAGFDTRSLRLDFLKNIQVIEIDHPDTAQFKIEKIKSFMGHLPLNVKYYQIDFNHESLNDLALKNNLDLDIPTTFIWEGVTNYLEQEAIDKTLEFVSKFSNKSCIIFTYINKLVLDNPSSFQSTEKYHSILEDNEEKWTFGFNPEKLQDYLNKFNLTVIEDLGAVEYRQRYLAERKNLLQGYEFYRVVIAELNK
jgi:methyltransferase (TIGR00027 family)